MEFFRPTKKSQSIRHQIQGIKPFSPISYQDESKNDGSSPIIKANAPKLKNRSIRFLPKPVFEDVHPLTANLENKEDNLNEDLTMRPHLYPK